MTFTLINKIKIGFNKMLIIKHHIIMPVIYLLLGLLLLKLK
jgi:hypothetical protein